MNSEQFLGWLERKSQLNSSNIFEKPLIMGVLNVTSDSFYDGGKYLSMDRACEHALQLIAHGADLIDIGGESTKPGAMQVPLDVELSRVIPVIKQLRKVTDVCISVDTNKPEVMERAVEAGANIINDIYALRKEGALAMAAKLGVPVCLMHMQGDPQNMQDDPSYPEGIMTNLCHFFEERIEACQKIGLDKKKLILDPGFGFGKRVKDNLELIYHLNELHSFGLPILLGVSRKSTIGVILNKEVEQRLIGSITVGIYAALKGVAIIRTHDVEETNQALTMVNAIYHTSNNPI
ncbi:dihydropteroate synthase [Legionella norrlandica]|uniref:Dihydropteroate synthase n=1 Tax=Legionella norrlandica TaxID=1498499 RepID=A0A0A2SX84_9GAMM|nr:dihydropteroate synthase [Legionella norrlandica]KGP64336.1 dihydropteroate synthase [Legionella norrlandica]